MVEKRVILATAGSGKTYHIANSLHLNQRNLILTFTNQNVKNIEEELKKRVKDGVSKTTVMTFSKFLYRWLIRPFEPNFTFADSPVASEGVDIFSTPFEPTDSEGNRNWRYITDNKLHHYLNKRNKCYYSSRMSKLFIKQGAVLHKKALQRLKVFFDYIYIDEVQDFRGNDFEIVKKLLNLKGLSVIAVGDFYQHSVSKSNFREKKPFKKGKQDVTEEMYLASFNKTIIIDKNTLIKSRRVPEEMCGFIREKLNIDIYSSSPERGEIRIVNEIETLNSVLQDDNVMKLVEKKYEAHSFSPLNTWSYCKGDTYENTCIILTGSFSDVVKDGFSFPKKVSQAQINKLYVALTRATNINYIVPKKVYDSWKTSAYEKTGIKR
ncbi:UvrD-helicase domain-containing protein [Tetzosporium hominis]|uniref:UvrD-helicase domain-containing protein n=1 Tax=Tetzosporium hominis TaxID=2020506 RepID=UPI0013FD755A|nr:UvrD-helicase domain-containing protein [Tetzosporium hominis]